MSEDSVLSKGVTKSDLVGGAIGLVILTALLFVVLALMNRSGGRFDSWRFFTGASVLLALPVIVIRMQHRGRAVLMALCLPALVILVGCLLFLTVAGTLVLESSGMLSPIAFAANRLCQECNIAPCSGVPGPYGEFSNGFAPYRLSVEPFHLASAVSLCPQNEAFA